MGESSIEECIETEATGELEGFCIPTNAKESKDILKYVLPNGYTHKVRSILRRYASILID